MKFDIRQKFDRSINIRYIKILFTKVENNNFRDIHDLINSGKVL